MSPVRFELQNFCPRGNFFWNLTINKGSSNTFKTRKKYQPVFQKKAPNHI